MLLRRRRFNRASRTDRAEVVAGQRRRLSPLDPTMRVGLSRIVLPIQSRKGAGVEFLETGPGGHKSHPPGPVVNHLAFRDESHGRPEA
jgi:hypothetical protein